MNRSHASPLRILIADDHPDIGETLAYLIRLEGHHVELAFDGAAALRVARDLKPDLILLDIGMPELDGYQVAWQIRRSRGDSVMLVALTSWGREEDKARALQAGFDLHLTKPVDPEILLKLIAHLGVELQRRAAS